MNEQEIEALALQLKREKNRAYYQKHKKRILNERKQKRATNLEAAHEKERAYRAANPEKIKEWQENYWKRQAEKKLQKNKKA